MLLFVVLCSSAGRVVKKVTMDDAKTAWEKTLYFAMYKAESKSLSLESYRYLGDIKSEKKRAALLDDIFSDDEYMVVANYEDNIFKIMTYGECKKLSNSKSKDNLYLPRKKLVTSQIAKYQIGVVELCWNYNGKKFKSKAIVSTDGEKRFLYDNIMNYAPTDNCPGPERKTTVNYKGYKTETYHNSKLKEYEGDGTPLTITYSRNGEVLKEEIHEFPRKNRDMAGVAKNTYRINGEVVKEEVFELPHKKNTVEAGVAKNTYRVNGKVVKEEVFELPHKKNTAEAGVAKTTYRVNGKVVKEEIEDLKTLTNQK